MTSEEFGRTVGEAIVLLTNMGVLPGIPEGVVPPPCPETEALSARLLEVGVPPEAQTPVIVAAQMIIGIEMLKKELLRADDPEGPSKVVLTFARRLGLEWTMAQGRAVSSHGQKTVEALLNFFPGKWEGKG
jgi:hypothetical protein